jgi:hypothetical protein
VPEIKLAYLILDATSWFMTGLIWFVQIVHYPLFANVGAEQSKNYAQLHCNFTGAVVVVPMILQGLLSLGLAFFAIPENAFLLWINFALITFIWILTALYSVPSHRSLCSNGFTMSVHQTLLRANWARTILWTICSIIISLVLFRQFGR